MEKVVSVNDLSGTGRCSLYTAISVMASLKVNCVPLPTAILSNQTGVSGFSFFDFTNEMESYISAWKKQGQKFKNIHTGFLTGEKQLDIVCKFIDEFSEDGANIVVDPVMADDGELYSVYGASYVSKMRELCKRATILTPNITELFFLAEMEGKEPTEENIIKATEKIKSEKTKTIFVTGILSGDKIKTFAYDCTCGKTEEIVTKYNGKSYSGTGDFFSSVIAALVARGKDSFFASKIAAEFISKAAFETEKQGGDTRDGILFEEYLGELDEID